MGNYITMGGNSLIRLAFIVSVLVFSVFSVSADVVSINSGGSEEMVISSDLYIEGFLFAPFPSGEDPVVDDGDDDGGGGGAGGGTIPGTNISLTPSWDTTYGIDLAIDTTRDESITAANLGSSEVTITLTHNFGTHLQILGNDTLTIPAGQSKIFEIRFIAGSVPETIAGVITISDKTVLTSLDISTELLLFDSNIIVLNKDYKVEKGKELKTQVTLIPLGDKKRLDVTLNYEIKDFNNKVYLTKSETLLIEEELNFKRDFDTGPLPLGDYVVALELIYPNGVAPSSASFKVVEKEGIFGSLIFYLIVLILIIGICILIILIYKRRKKKGSSSSSIFGSGSSSSSGSSSERVSYSAADGQPL
jgi:hypothetical protein